MIKWLQDNPVGTGLAAFCGVLVLLVILLTVVWTLPPSGSGVNSDEGANIASLDLPELRDAGKIEDYEEIISRPVFNESRQPVIETGEEDDVTEEEMIEDVDAPDVELAGVIITPSLRMATLKEKGQEHSMVAFEGRPLEGDYGSWQITSIEPRTVTLTSGDGEELELKLQVHNAKMAEPPKTAEPLTDLAEESAEDAAADENDDVQTLSRAEEIRQRIAERREELKRAAESEEGQQEMTYQQAIQNMMGKKRQDNSNNEQKE